MSDVIDADVLKDFAGGSAELVAELIDTFDRECPRLLEQMRSAAAAGDREDLVLAVHTIRSSLRLFGARAAGDIAEALERVGRAGELDEVSSRLHELELEVERVRGALARIG